MGARAPGLQNGLQTRVEGIHSVEAANPPLGGAPLGAKLGHAGPAGAAAVGPVAPVGPMEEPDRAGRRVDPIGWVSAPSSDVTAERVVVSVALLVLCALAWVWLGRDLFQSSAAAPFWNGGGLALGWAHWAAIVGAVTLPATLPTLLAFASAQRRRRQRGTGFAALATGAFLAGYAFVWLPLCAGAAWVTGFLASSGELSEAGAFTSLSYAGASLVAIGIYLLTPFRSRCARWFRSPLRFLLNRWEDRGAGALRMGVRYGGYALGAVGLPLGLLYVGGVASLPWLVGLAAFCALERLVTRRGWLEQVPGVALVAVGVITLVQPSL